MKREKGREAPAGLIALLRDSIEWVIVGYDTESEEELSMGDCASCGNGSGAGPFSEGRELVEFVYNAHGGAIKDQPIPGGGLKATCGGCGKSFTLKTYVGKCPHCGGVHAVSPPRSSDPSNIQFAGADFKLPE